ncbi:MAG: hypothetical protein WKF70_14465 [Chitinophagaceae bacterium]
MTRKSKMQTSEKTIEDIFKPKDFVITSASIKDGLCNYSFEIISGVGAGDTHNVKGSGIVDDDMATAFATFNTHLAYIDDVFKHSGTDVEDIDKMHSHDLSFLYQVSGFKIKGGKDNESIILMGSKSISSSGGRIELSSPRIPLDNLSSYKWYNELKVAADKARTEVELYKEGKYTAVEHDEPEEDHRNQSKFDFSNPEGKDEDEES